MRTADLDFIKVTEVGGIVRYSSKPEEGLCYIPGVRMETKQEAINRLVNIAVNGCGGVVKYTVNGWEEVPTDNSLTAKKTRIEQALEDLRHLKCEEYAVVKAAAKKLMLRWQRLKKWLLRKKKQKMRRQKRILSMLSISENFLQHARCLSKKDRMQDLAICVHT